MGRGHWIRMQQAVLCAAVVAAIGPAAANAKPWAKLAPKVPASDSSYAVLLAQPAESLTADELAWLEVQNDWRAQRKEELRSSGSITEPFHPHHGRLTDARFAELASRPYASLADSERTWLVAENTAQRVDRGLAESSHGSSVVGIVLLSAIAGAVIASVLIANAYSHIPYIFFR